MVKGLPLSIGLFIVDAAVIGVDKKVDLSILYLADILI